MGFVRDMLRQVYIRNPLGQFEVTTVLVGLPTFLVYSVRLSRGLVYLLGIEHSFLFPSP